MAIVVTAAKSINIGEPVEVHGDSPVGRLSAVFEDDGATGYFYFIDFGVSEHPIQDAIHVYDVANVADGHLPSEIKIGWSLGGENAVLLINGHPHVAFASVDRVAHSRSCFPPPVEGSGWARSEWSDDSLALFASES